MEKLSTDELLQWARHGAAPAKRFILISRTQEDVRF